MPYFICYGYAVPDTAYFSNNLKFIFSEHFSGWILRTAKS